MMAYWNASLGGHPLLRSGAAAACSAATAIRGCGVRLRLGPAGLCHGRISLASVTVCWPRDAAGCPNLKAPRPTRACVRSRRCRRRSTGLGVDREALEVAAAKGRRMQCARLHLGTLDRRRAASATRRQRGDGPRRRHDLAPHHSQHPPPASTDREWPTWTAASPTGWP